MAQHGRISVARSAAGALPPSGANRWQLRERGAWREQTLHCVTWAQTLHKDGVWGPTRVTFQRNGRAGGRVVLEQSECADAAHLIVGSGAIRPTGDFSLAPCGANSPLTLRFAECELREPKTLRPWIGRSHQVRINAFGEDRGKIVIGFVSRAALESFKRSHEAATVPVVRVASAPIAGGFVFADDDEDDDDGPLQRTSSQQIRRQLEQERAARVAQEQQLVALQKQVSDHSKEKAEAETLRRAASELDAMLTFYHGTSVEAGIAIQRGGFNVDLSGTNAGTMLGDGVYLTTTLGKAMSYAAEPPIGYSEAGSRPLGGCVLKLKVDLGRCKELTHNDLMMRSWHRNGFDSAHSGDGVNGRMEEHCVRDAKRVTVVDVVLGNVRTAGRAQRLPYAYGKR